MSGETSGLYDVLESSHSHNCLAIEILHATTQLGDIQTPLVTNILLWRNVYVLLKKNTTTSQYFMSVLSLLLNVLVSRLKKDHSVHENLESVQIHGINYLVKYKGETCET